MKRLAFFGAVVSLLLFEGCRGEETVTRKLTSDTVFDCGEFVEDLVLGDIRHADGQTDRFLGKVDEKTARCFGGSHAVDFRHVPWVDWKNYWAAGDDESRRKFIGIPFPATNLVGINGSLLDLEYQRLDLIRFNLFDNAGTYEEYVTEGTGQIKKQWDAMRLSPEHPYYEAVGGDGAQECSGDLIRHRNLDGICNDIRNPLMGSTHTPFARNVQFESTFPRLGKNELTRNRHGDRLELLEPDPQLISRKLFTRKQSNEGACEQGGMEDDCGYQKAPFFNVLAAFWIQFMNHDWFSHLVEGHNQQDMMAVGCTTEQARRTGCRPGDRIDKAYVADDSDPPTFTHDGKEHLARAFQTTNNTVTAWWDASQIYGYDDVSRQRVKRDPDDPAKLLVVELGERPGNGEEQGYLPLLEDGDPMNPAWSGQEATAFPDNWTVGLSFYHTVFAREHNAFVEAFRAQAATTPTEDSGLRNPNEPDEVIRYQNITTDELFEAARLVVAAEIAKIHTIEWTTQLLYDEPLFKAMNSNWNGLFAGHPLVERVLGTVIKGAVDASGGGNLGNAWYSIFASGPGIVGLGSHRYEGDPDSVFTKYDPTKTDLWDLSNPDHVNGGVNHFGSPFNFPEEFVSVYRLHPLLPDLLEYRELDDDANIIRDKVPVVATFRGKATQAMRERGLANWALSMGRQRLGALTLQNHPHFLQNLKMPARLADTETQTIDVAALDIVRDRERGVPRFNEFRRQYGLKTLTSFDDFIDQRADSAEQERQGEIIGLLREIYGQHRCDVSKVITEAQLNDDGTPINDCLGHPDATMVDNVEDVDLKVGWLAEFSRPHGYAISETQFQVFILNASRRLFSDRFFTSSFRPEFYTKLGHDWVRFNGPDGTVMEIMKSNGTTIEVSPLKRVLLRTIPELAPELEHVVNAFDPWARDRGKYYSLEWRPRDGAEDDPAFSESPN
ncbi:MAG: oxygenase [Acidobacteria bacterium]|nr:MAG: oxygenase [Acidobacteriota bacterium]